MSRRSASIQALGLAGWLAVAFAAGGIGAIASVEAVTFYQGLVRPAWAPPAAAFAPVWSTLYALMALAAWLVWRAPAGTLRRGALAVFVVQLAVNAVWSWLFFVWRQGALAFADAVALFALIALMLAAFWRIRPIAGALLLPYLAWVGFACALTWSIWQANPAAFG